ncbi:MAG: FecR family protein, partial [Myxococcota bacterium]|nr:FecR family protein [Myxococcota bacterium]
RWLWLAAPAVATAAIAAVVIGTRGGAPVGVDDSPTRVVSGAAPSTISFGDAHVTLEADSAVVMSRDATTTAVLEHGAAWFAIPKRTRPFVVVAGDTVVRVVGTRFRVARFEERATVEVEDGTVNVTFQGTSVQIAAGQAWTSELPASVHRSAADAPTDPRPATPATTPDARQL